MGLGAFALALAALAVLGLLWYLVVNSRIRHRRERAPENQSPYITDDELESRKLDTVLRSALLSSVVLAIVLPLYYLNETSRQESAAERYEDISVERGHEWFTEYECFRCHGLNGGGGGAPFVEGRSGIPVTWSAPSLNDIFYRYTEDEARFWIVYGRQGTPMPAWGVPGGGPLNEQQVDELLAYIESLQIPQAEAVAPVDDRVNQELARLENADETVAAAIEDQEAEVAALQAIPEQYAQLKDIPTELRAILTGSSTCTAESAAVAHVSCDADNPDGDRDGISDAAEAALSTLVERVISIAPSSDARGVIEGIEFDPASGFTTSEGGRPIADLEQLPILVTEFGTIERDLRLTSDNLAGLVETADAGLAALRSAQENRRWAFDVEALAAAGFDGNITQTRRATGLFNAYCARCHTAGYSAGVAFTTEAGSGALGPSLREGRSVVQFPDPEDHYDFIVSGSVSAQAYGINGIGRGWMPGFGALLSQADIELIVQLERVLP